MKAFSHVAQDLGYHENAIMLSETGRVIEIRKDAIRQGEEITVENIYVDGLGVGDVGNVVLRDRQTMAEEGVVVVIVTVDKNTGDVVKDPDMISRGFVYEKESEELLAAGIRIIKDRLRDFKPGEALSDWRNNRRTLEESLEKFFYKETNRRPLILPVVIEV
jgi:ribonuclease J